MSLALGDQKLSVIGRFKPVACVHFNRSSLVKEDKNTKKADEADETEEGEEEGKERADKEEEGAFQLKVVMASTVGVGRGRLWLRSATVASFL